jgi:hypothetical protein
MDAPVNGMSVPALFRHTLDRYEILIDTSGILLPSSDSMRLLFDFDAFFVPRNIGLNDDGRELVVQAPDLVELTRP